MLSQMQGHSFTCGTASVLFSSVSASSFLHGLVQNIHCLPFEGEGHRGVRQGEGRGGALDGLECMAEY